MLECFKFVKNKSHMVQVVFSDGMEPIKMNPGEVFDVSGASFVPSVFERIPSIISYIFDNNIKAVTLQRSFAMGDVLMLVPVAKYIGENYGLDVSVKVPDDLKEVVSLLGAKVVPNPAGLFISLDGVVEHDHISKECQRYHRVELYLRSLGIDGKVKSSDFSWDCDLGKFGYPVLEGDYVVFQGMGSRPHKSLKPETVNEMLRILSKKYKVAYIGSEKEIEKIDNVFYAGYKYSFVQLFNIIGLAKCLVCMDSAPLWISHFTKTPVVAVLGPTPARNRVSFHPLYEDGAKAVQLNDNVNCPSCFERASACNYSFKCLNVLGKELYEKIGGYVEGFMGN